MKAETRRAIGKGLVAAGSLIILGSLTYGAYSTVENGILEGLYKFAVGGTSGLAIGGVGMELLYDLKPFAMVRVPFFFFFERSFHTEGGEGDLALPVLNDLAPRMFWRHKA